MIKFFRKIRLRLATGRKFSNAGSNSSNRWKSGTAKYLIYAVGEILLVVIGILIALQINNWNEWRKERWLENSFLEKIAEDIRQDIDQYKKIIGTQDAYGSQIDSFINIIRNPLSYQTRDLDRYYKALWYFERFTPTRNAIDNIISSGKINIIKNEKVLDATLNYYKTIDEHTRSVDDALATYSRTQIGPYMMKFDFMHSESANSQFRQRRSLMEYHQDPAIENLVSARVTLNETQKWYYEDQINAAYKLLEMLAERKK